MQIVQHPSPNFGERRGGVRPDLIVLHYTAMANASDALERLCDPAYEVSAHFFIHTDGTTCQMVAEDQRAWHAGAGAWGACSDINSRSFGIELSNTGDTPFAAAQMDALEQLLAILMKRWNIRPEGVIAHSDLAPSRKCDPGRRFDWRRLAQTEVSVWPEAVEPATPDAAAFCRMAARFGYNGDETIDHILEAFRQRFRPWAEGPLNASDMAAIGNLATRFPVDQKIDTP